MKLILNLVFLLALASSFAQNKGGWTVDFSSNLGFTENLNRYENLLDERIEFFVETGQYGIFLSNDAFVFAQKEDLSMEELHERREKREHGEPVEPVKCDYFKIEFIGTNPSREIQPQNQLKHTRHFQNPLDPSETVKAHCFNELTYKNIYPNIDLLLEIPTDGGLKYTFIVHAGANPNDILMEYSGADIYLEEGDLKIGDENVRFMDHAPHSFIGEEEIESSFILEENKVRFFVEDYDRSMDLIIDPWIVTDIPDGPTQKALEITYDDAGNCAALVSSGILDVYEDVYHYNNIGILEWTWSNVETGDITKDPITGQVYCIGLLTDLHSLTPGGILSGTYDIGGAGPTQEVWRLKYNESFDKVATGDGGLDDPSSQVTIIEPDLSDFTEYEPMPNPLSDMEDCVLFEIDPSDGSYYMVPGRSAGFGYAGYQNKLFHLDATDPSTILWEAETNHDFLETTNALYSYKVGVNGIACSDDFVYTYDGNRLVQYNKFSGARTDSLFLGLSLNGQYGLDTDSCGLVYVGGPSNVFIFNEDLDEVGTYDLPSHCYDLIIGNGKLYACGTEYIKMIELEIIEEEFILESTPKTCDACNGTATFELPPAVCSSLDFESIVWSPSGETDLAITGLCEGWHVATTTWTYMDGSDTTIVDSVEVLAIDPPLPVDFDIMNALCAGTCTGEVEMTPLDGDAPYVYIFGIETNGTGEFTDICPGDFVVTVTDANGCTMDTLIEITEPEPLTAAIIDHVNVSCFEGADGSVTIEATGGTEPYQFDIGEGPVGSGEFVGLAAGTYSITVTDENDCTYEISVDISEPAELTLTEIAIVHLLCNDGETGAIEVLGSGGTGILNYSIDAVTFDTDPSFTGLTADDYTVIVRDENDCETSIDLTLIEPDPISSLEITVDEVCEGNCEGSINLDASGGTPPFLYSIDDCVTLLPTETFEDLCPSDYAICIEDANGCRYTNILSIGPGLPPANATIEALGPFCIDDDPMAITVAEPGILTGDGVTGGLFDPSLAGAGTHTITNTISDVCGGAVATFDVIVHPLPIVNFSVSENSECIPFEVLFTNTGETEVNCEWAFGDGSIAATCGEIKHVYSEPGIYDVSLTVIDANGCSATTTYYDYIEAHAIPVADFVFAPVTVTTLDPSVEFRDLSSGADNWIWYFDEIGNSTDQNPSFVFPDEQGEYTVTQIAISSKGCKDTISKTIMVQQEHLIFVPNTITPDGDSYNDVFLPYLTGIDINDYHLMIFNRWGETLFESYDLSRGWDGTYGDGDVVQDGVYIWQIVVSDKNTDRIREYRGHVNVMR